jgi:hypothetical protein
MRVRIGALDVPFGQKPNQRYLARLEGAQTTQVPPMADRLSLSPSTA